MAPTSCSTAIAHPRTVRIAGRRSFIISIEIAPARDESLRAVPVPGTNTGQGFRIAVALAFPPVPPPCVKGYAPENAASRQEQETPVLRAPHRKHGIPDHRVMEYARRRVSKFERARARRRIVIMKDV